MATYIVRRGGRESTELIRRQNNDIYINDDTVSSFHGKIVDCGAGRYEFWDTNSTNGTFIRESRGWTRIRTAELSESDEIRLGMFETRLCDLLRPETSPPGRSGVRIERNPETGEIIQKKWR
jgi:pSer/pThr/pTyr-binding forkhead associated (FHA) protein